MLTRTIQTQTGNIEHLTINNDGTITIQDAATGADTIRTKKISLSFVSEAGERFTYSITRKKQQDETAKRFRETATQIIDEQINELITSGWFDKSRTISDIMQKLEKPRSASDRSNFAGEPNEVLSGPLIFKRLKKNPQITKKGSFYFHSF